MYLIGFLTEEDIVLLNKACYVYECSMDVPLDEDIEEVINELLTLLTDSDVDNDLLDEVLQRHKSLILHYYDRFEGTPSAFRIALRKHDLEITLHE